MQFSSPFVEYFSQPAIENYWCVLYFFHVESVEFLSYTIASTLLFFPVYIIDSIDFSPSVIENIRSNCKVFFLLILEFFHALYAVEFCSILWTVYYRFC